MFFPQFFNTPETYTYIILDGEKVLNLIGKLRGPFYRILGIKTLILPYLKAVLNMVERGLHGEIIGISMMSKSGWKG